MKTSDFDKKFDAGEDISQVLDLKKARRPGLEVKRVNVDFSDQQRPVTDGDIISCAVPQNSRLLP